MKNAHNIFVRDPEGKRQLGKSGENGKKVIHYFYIGWSAA